MRRSAFTLLELLAVMAVVAMLATLPAVHSTMQAARAVQCRAQLRQLGVALGVHVDSQGYFPLTGSILFNLEVNSGVGISAQARLLP